jgi:hypothetical protein
MALNRKWIDQIFARLSVRYGSAFLGRWTNAGIDLELVKADWAEELAGFERNPEALKHALQHLPVEPPNVMQFRALANGAPPPELPRLPEPKADPERVQRALQAARLGIKRVA